ncbi:MAG: hypothetical protein PHI02_04315 [Sulfurovaceae bacterium]|nr:hypothetical protein [Sulfurovaceae bacterium]
MSESIVNKLDFNIPFDEQVSKIKTKKGGHLVVGSHNYYILRALFYGNTIDDYEKAPFGKNNRRIRNIRSRIAQLRNEWCIPIESSKGEDGRTSEYRLIGAL